MNAHYYAVIMAGGGGTRLWPLSRKATPKQVLDLSGNGRSLFQLAVERLQGVFPPERILIVTTAGLAKKLQVQAPEIPKNNYLLEPIPRGTASVVGFAASALKVMDPNPQTCMAILTADHFIQNVDSFQRLLLAAHQAAMDDYFVTLGVMPTYPSTGYGYIQQGQSGQVYDGQPSYQVKKFTEKPDQATANKMMAEGTYLWNSGMFIWKVDVILKAFETFMPDLAQKLNQIRQGWKDGLAGEVIERIWPSIIPETIDYGIMEKVERVVVLPAKNLDWYDVGSWESLFEVLPADENGNIIIGSGFCGLDTTGTLIFSTNPQRMVATIGLRDMVIVDTKDALLVCSKHDSQSVKKVIDTLKQLDRGDYL